MPDVPVTRLGHASFRLDISGGKRVYFDPFLNGNPKCPDSEQEPERIEMLWDNTRYFKKGLSAAGFNTGISETPITPVIVGEAKTAHQLSRELFNGGVLATGIGFPTVAKGKARVRTIVSATHTKPELDRALEVFRAAGKKLGLI